jgi:hypothetical protein
MVSFPSYTVAVVIELVGAGISRYFSHAVKLSRLNITASTPVLFLNVIYFIAFSF